MQATLLNDIVGATFRGNANYEFVSLDCLSDGDHAQFAGLQGDSEVFGLLRPRRPGPLTVKAVCRETALIWSTLQSQGPLPVHIRHLFGGDCASAVAKLVLDGVLEMKYRGSFVTGPEAYLAMYGAPPAPDLTSATARLSLDALRYGQSLDIDESQRLSARLYFYNRVPLSPYWKRRLPTPDAVATWLGIGGRGATQSALNESWSETSASSSDYWLTWDRGRGRHPSRRLRTSSTSVRHRPRCATRSVSLFKS